MKVLLIDVTCKSGSTGKIVYDLHTNLIADGYESAICYGRGYNINEKNIYKFSSSIEVVFHAIMTRITGFTGCFSFFSTKKLLKYMRDYKPDVVHIHELHGYFVNIKPVLEYLKKNSIKTVWTFHCEFMYTGRCGYAYDCEKWKDICGRCPDIREYPASIIFDFSKKMHLQKQKMFIGFDNLILVTPSLWLEKRVRQSFLKNKKIVKVHNGIDTENVFYPRQCDLLKKKHNLTDEKIVLAVAPDIMTERKGGRIILELAKKMKNENIKFILIGVKGEREKYDNNIIALSKTENQHELAKYYSLADVFVICSLKENFPTVCLEALCCGTPVCGFEAGGTAETAIGEFGKFVGYGNIDNLKDAILEMLRKPTMTNQCAEYGKSRYSKVVMYENYKNLYIIEQS